MFFLGKECNIRNIKNFLKDLNIFRKYLNNESINNLYYDFKNYLKNEHYNESDFYYDDIFNFIYESKYYKKTKWIYKTILVSIFYKVSL